MPRKKSRSSVYLISIGAHVALAVAIAAIPQKRLREVIAIALAETHPNEPKPARPTPPSTPPAPARRLSAPAMAKAAAVGDSESSESKSATPYLDIGLSLDSASLDGLAIPSSAVTHTPTIVAHAPPARPKLLLAKSIETPCREELVKPVAQNIVEPKYTAEAERAGIEGRVRLALQVSPDGDVESALILSGLGYGLDETAVAAVKRMKFRPGLRCGRAVAATFTLAVRFKL